MKIRSGFVSNSSASSFCIYGISFEKKDYETYNGLIKELLQLTDEAVLINAHDEWIFGVGTYEQEVDHYFENGEDWRDYESQGPTDKAMEIFEQFAKDKGIDLSNYDCYACTWYDG